MAGDWIKVEAATPDKPELVRMASILGIDQDAVFGKLIRIWAWADQNVVIPDNESDAESDGASVTVGVTPAFIDRLAFCPGFADSLAAVNWLIINADSVTFPRFGRHNGKTAKDRALTARRMAKLRGKSDAESDGASVTSASAREEKRREEKKEPIKKQPSAKKISFAEWQASIPEGEEAFPPGHYIHQYVADVGLPGLFQDLAWFHFSTTFGADASKKQADWPRHFRNALKGNWCKAWWINDQGEYCLTTVGKQLQKQMESA